MANEYQNLRKWDTRWTPVTDEVVELLWAVRREHGGSWLDLADAVGMKVRHLRRLYLKTNKAVSLRVMDNILARSNYSYRMHSLPWYTVEELMEHGVWENPLPRGGH